MLIQKQTVTNHATLKPQLWPFFLILRGWEQGLQQKQKLTSTLHSSLTRWVFFLSSDSYTAFLPLSPLLFQFPKNKPSVNIIEA